MKRVHQEQGERDWAFEDLRELQSEPLKAVDSVFGSFGDCVISGCNVVGNTISSGMVSIGGKVMPFEGAADVTFPCKLVASVEEIIGKYVDNGDKPIAHNYKAVVAAEGEGIEITTSGGANILRRGSDAVDSDSSITFATSKAVAAVNTKLGELAGKELLKSDAIDFEDSDTLATSMAVATAVKHLDSKIVDTSLPVSTILTTTADAGNIYGEKWLKCDGSQVYFSDYPLLKITTNSGEKVLQASIHANRATSFDVHAYLNGNYIMMSTYDMNMIWQIHYSTNLRSWSRVEPGIRSASIGGIIFANGKYYTYGSTWAGIMSSIDLRTWVNVSLGSNSFIATKMHYADGVIVVLNEKSISYTVDFSTKTNIVLPESLLNETWVSVNYCNGLWMIGSINGIVITSSNLIDWIQCDLVFNNGDREIKDFCYFNSQWIVSSNNGIAISKNGITDWIIIDLKIRGGYNQEGQFNIADNILFVRAEYKALISENGIDWYPILLYYKNFFQNTAVNMTNQDNTYWSVYGTDILKSNFKKTLPNIANSYIKSLR